MCAKNNNLKQVTVSYQEIRDLVRNYRNTDIGRVIKAKFPEAFEPELSTVYPTATFEKAKYWEFRGKGYCLPKQVTWKLVTDEHGFQILQPFVKE